MTLISNLNSEKSDLIIALTTTSISKSTKLANDLVKHRLAACVSIIPTIKSVYWWKDKINEEQEELLIIKTSKQRIEELKNRIQEIHEYDVPELIIIPISDGLEEYFNWIRTEMFKGKLD